MNDSEQILEAYLLRYAKGFEKMDDSEMDAAKAAILQHYISKKEVERAIGEEEWLADATLNMSAEEVKELDKELDTVGRIKRNQLRAKIRNNLGLDDKEKK